MEDIRKSLKWLAWSGAAVLAAAAAVLALLVYAAGQHLEATVAALRAAGEPTTMAELAPIPIPPADNAATYLRRAARDIDAIESDVSAADAKLSAPGRSQFEGTILPSEMRSAIRSAVEAHPSALTLIDEASHCGGYDAGLDFHLEPEDLQIALQTEMDVGRKAFSVLECRALLQLAEGEREEAMKTCLTLFRLRRLLVQYPLVEGHSLAVFQRTAVQITNRVLRSETLSESSPAALERQLALEDPAANFRDTIRGGRAYLVERWQNRLPEGFALLKRRICWLKDDEFEFLDLVSVAIATDPLPRDAWRRAVDTAAPPGRVGRLANSVLTDLEQYHDHVLSSLSEIRALRVLNALQAREESGKSELKIEELGLPADATIDPFTGLPLIVKRLPEGWLIYSVGPDLKDDGGDLAGSSDVGVGPVPPAKAGGDTPSDVEAGEMEASGVESKP